MAPPPPLYHHRHHQIQLCCNLRCFVERKKILSRFTHFLCQIFELKMVLVSKKWQICGMVSHWVSERVMVSRLDCWVRKLMKMIKLKCQFKEIRSLDQICIVGFSFQLTHEKSDIYKMLRERCKQNWIMCHFGGRDRPVCALPYRICLLPFPIEKSFTTFIFIWKWKWEKDKVKGKVNVRKRKSESERNAKDKSTGQGMLASGGNISLVIAVPSLSCR